MRLPKINLRWWLSPTVAVVISTLFGLLCLLPGQSLYDNFGEVGKTQDWLPAFWIVACGFFFLAGVMAMRAVPRGRTLVVVEPSQIPTTRLLLLGLIALAANLLALYRLVGVFGVAGSINAILGIGTSDIRLAVFYALKAINIGWALAFTTPVAAVLTVAIVRLKQRGQKSRPLLFTLVALIVVNIVVALFTQSKGSLFSAFVVVIIAALLDRSGPIKIKFKGLVASILLVVVVVVGSMILQSRRNSDVGGGGVVNDVAAYTVISYNRMAYLLNGDLILPNMDVGFWTNRWWWGLPGTQPINSGLAALGFGIPDAAFDSWLDTFNATYKAGLNPSYIWTTIYGEAFADYRWWGCLWFFFYGVLSQFLFRQLNRGSLGVHSLYAWFAMSNLQWFSGATATTRGLLFGVLIMLYLGARIRGPRLQLASSSRRARLRFVLKRREV